MPSRAPILIALPSGLIVSGVATWAARLVSALAARGGVAGLILHATPAGHAPLRIDLHPAVRVFDLSSLPRFEDMAPGLRTPVEIAAARDAWVSAYLDAARVLARDAAGAKHAGAHAALRPVVLSPNLHADCYATCVEVSRRAPGLVRLVGWQHNDIEYDRRVLAHYESALAEVVGVSDHIVALLQAALSSSRVRSVAYGVEVPEALTTRESWSGDGTRALGRASMRVAASGALSGAGAARPVRLLYTGRLDHYQKRILAMPHMSAALVDMGIDHTLTIMGDGPAAADVEQTIRMLEQQRTGRMRGDAGTSLPAPTSEARGFVGAPVGGFNDVRRAHASPPQRGRLGVATRQQPDADPPAPSHALPIRLTGAATPGDVRRALHSHDAFVLASRFEGLSVSMLEALAAGCVPIVARVASGALQAIEHGVTGLVAEVDPAADERAVGTALAEQVAAFLAGDPAKMSERAWRAARDRFSLERHVDAASGVIDACAERSAPVWPADRPVWFSDLGGSIPDDAPMRLARVLSRLAGRSVVIHGTGLHTRVLLAHLLRGPARIVALADDDRQRHGQSMGGLPIIAPGQAAASGATDVVISTWIHEDAVWRGRAVYEDQGLTVHRLYADATTEDGTPVRPR